MSEKRKVHILSFGAGVQSSTLALLFAKDELPYKLDCAIFADTQAEPPEVYNWLDFIVEKTKHKFPTRICTEGSLEAACLGDNKRTDKSHSPVPFYLKDQKGNVGLGRRQCTFDYKIEPVQREVKHFLGYENTRKRVKEDVTMHIGISVDEMQRCKESRVKWIKHHWPLIMDKWWRRGQCIEWFEKEVGVKPPRSACYFCPYMSDKEWVHIKENEPELFEKAIAFDAEIRNRGGKKGEQFLHKSGIPLKDIDFQDPNINQLSLISMEDECDGICGM